MSSDIGNKEYVSDEYTWRGRWRRAQPYLAVLLASVAATPLAVMLTLSGREILGPVMLYGALGFFFGYHLPRIGWRWGCWVPLGIPIVFIIIILSGWVQPPQEDPSGLPIPYASLSGLAFVLLYAPAQAGAVVGSLIGGLVGRRVK